jgi:hypothetical protein
MLERRLKFGARLLLPGVFRRYVQHQTVEFREEPPQSRDHLRRP